MLSNGACVVLAAIFYVVSASDGSACDKDSDPTVTSSPSSVVTLDFYGTDSLRTNFSVGSPPQNVSMALVPGSDIIFGEASSGCALPDHQCQEVFNPNKSSTWLTKGTSTMKGTNAIQLLFGSDDILVAGQNLTTIEVGYAYGNSTNAILSSNCLGFGPPGGENSVLSYSGGEFIGEYETLPLLLKSRGMTDSATWSLELHTNSSSSWIGYEMARSARIAFGNVDTTKYQCSFTVVPIVNAAATAYEVQINSFPSSAPPQTLNIMLHGLSVKHFGEDEPHLVGNLSLPSSIWFSTGLTLPNELINTLMTQVGAVASGSLGEWLVPCNTSASIQLDFSGMLVEVPFQKLLHPIIVYDGFDVPKALSDAAASLNASNICSLSMQSGPPGIGVEILDMLYTVIDLENYEISFARTLENSSLDTSPEWERIPREGIENATKAASYSSTQHMLPYSLVETTRSPLFELDPSASSALSVQDSVSYMSVTYKSDFFSGAVSPYPKTSSLAPTHASSSKNAAALRCDVFRMPLYIIGLFLWV